MSRKTSREYQQTRFETYGGRELFNSAKAINQKIRDTKKSLEIYKAKLLTEKDSQKILKIKKKIELKEAFLKSTQSVKLEKRVSKKRKLELFVYGLITAVSLKKGEPNTSFENIEKDYPETSHTIKLTVEFLVEAAQAATRPETFDKKGNYYDVSGPENFSLCYSESEIGMHKTHVQKLKEFFELKKEEGRDLKYLFNLVDTFKRRMLTVTEQEKKYVLRSVKKMLSASSIQEEKFVSALNRFCKPSERE